MKRVILILSVVLVLSIAISIPVSSTQLDTKHLNDFSSIQNLSYFLQTDTTDSHVYFIFDKKGVAKFTGVCETLAFQLRDNAESIGMRLETEILTPSECLKYKVDLGLSDKVLTMNEKNSHMIVKAIIGNDVYFIEPSNDKYILVYHLN